MLEGKVLGVILPLVEDGMEGVMQEMQVAPVEVEVLRT
jgi:hypothetical protein